MRAEIINIRPDLPGGVAAPQTAASGLTGVVLAGGVSPHFAGVDKGLIPVGGRALIKRVLEQLVAQVKDIVIVTNRNQSLYASHGYRVIGDALPDHQGPLSGMAAGLAAIETSHALFVPADAARLPRDLGQALWRVHIERLVPCLVHSADRSVPSCSLVPKSELAALEAALHAGKRDPLEWLKSRAAVEVDFRDWPKHFWSLHAPEDVAALEAALA